jgi:membrane protease YdiL (CAAX protease family)
MKKKNLFEAYPIWSYFILTFLISWSGLIIVSFFTGIPASAEMFKTVGVFAMIPLVFGPVTAGLFLTGIHSGRTGIRELFSKIIRWKQSPLYYLFAVLLFPVITLISMIILTRFFPDVLPKILTAENKTAFILNAAGTGIFLTLMEEIGWTGFALPFLRKRFSMLKSSLILGTIWGAWHFLPVFYGCGDASGKLNWDLFYPGLFFHYAGLIPVRILLVWLYEKTQTILLPWILHSFTTAFLFFIMNIQQSGLPLMIYYLLLSFFLWTISVFILKSSGRSVNLP